MKLKSLHIDSYRHLENLHFDFTYPEGHSKAGKPLDKICIIGQSATGKTSILELVRDSLSILNKTEIIDNQYISFPQMLNFDGSLEYIFYKSLIKIYKNKIIRNGSQYEYIFNGGGDPRGYVNMLTERFIKEDLKLLYLSSEIVTKDSINVFNEDPQKISTDANGFGMLSTMRDKITNKRKGGYIHQFILNQDKNIWISLLFDILAYRKKFTQMASELINKGAIGDLSKLNKEYNKWAIENENPLIPFSKYFNPILEKLNLEIDLVNTEYPIPIKSKITEEIIPISNLSTGTKGLLLSMFPLYELDTKDSIILYDEPERSLFPDMQIDLISHCKNLAPEAQFVVATHSPFIAAAFEPEERFILYFNDKGKVAVRRGESPIGDDPNDMLSNDFNVDYYNEFGKKAHKKYLELKREVSQETKPERKKELIVELAELGDKYNF
jgi:GTP-binding protein EngB required for normal cell division